MLSARYRYLNCGLILPVLFLTFAPNAAAESAKEQLQGTIDRVIEVLQTIRSSEDIEKNKGLVREILMPRFDFAAMAESRRGITGKIWTAWRKSLYRRSLTLLNTHI
jgi:ABC-type transporter MlaC component